MRAELVEEVLREAAAVRATSDPELAALVTAIILEDCLDITLTDDEIDPDVLGSPDLVRALVHSRLAVT